MKIRLKGKKLEGDYALVHIKGGEENAWLLIKKKDKYASSADITKKAASVLSGKTIQELAGNKNSKQSKNAKGQKADIKTVRKKYSN